MKEFNENIGLLISTWPLIVLVVIMAFKQYRKSRPRRQETLIEKRPDRELEKQSLLPKPISTQRALLNFIVVTVIGVLAASFVGVIFSILSNLIYIVFVFPLVMGLADGSVLTDALRRMKIRKTYQLIFISVVMAVATYGTYHYGRYIALQVGISLKAFPGLSQATEAKNLEAAKIVVDYALEQETGYPGFVGYMLFKAQEGVSIGRFYHSSRLTLGPVLTWFYWMVEFGIILYVTISMGKKQASMPFCTACGSWYGKEKHLGGTTPANEALVLDLIKQKDFTGLGNLLEQNADLPSLEVYFQGCENCNGGDSRLVLRRAFQGSKGGLQFTDAAQAVLQPSDGLLLLNELQ